MGAATSQIEELDNLGMGLCLIDNDRDIREQPDVCDIRTREGPVATAKTCDSPPAAWQKACVVPGLTEAGQLRFSQVLRIIWRCRSTT